MFLSLQCFFAPRLYKMYRDGPNEGLYEANFMEKFGDRVVSYAQTLFQVSMYASPLLCMYAYRRYTLDDSRGLGYIAAAVGGMVVFAFLLRGIGRLTNPKYMQFLNALNAYPTDPSQIEVIRKYDFDFKAWPVSYAEPPTAKKHWYSENPFRSTVNADLSWPRRTALQMFAFLAVHTFALRLIYPGALGIIHNLLGTALLQGRALLVERYKGKRAKITTADGNHIDTMFVDRRDQDPKSRTLVLCCEGNSGFYEIGIMITPIKAGYSVLGWNHPGFATSTGLPFPSQEQNAVSAVVQYAINELGFKMENIVLFGWSIGGYTAAWAAAEYPAAKALILDATFDDLLPLAERQMPPSWKLLVKEVVRSHVDLNVGELVTRYPGPVHLVRRTNDEIICMTPGVLKSNRGNELLLKIMDSRYPTLEGYVWSSVRRFHGVVQSQRDSVAETHPDRRVQMALNLINNHLTDFDSTHCQPLPEDVFARIMLRMKLVR